MAQSFIQPTFACGEISPNLYARVDLAKYHAACKLLRNMFVWTSGGASNRAGTMFVGRCRNSEYPVHLIPFQFNLLQTYILEFGHQYMRVIMNGGYVLEPSFVIGAVTNANPGVVTTGTAHGYSNGDQVFISGTGTVLDSTPGRQYLVENATANTFTLTDLDGNVINTTSYGVYGGSGGAVARVFAMATPYAGADVQLIKWTQSADTLTLCHPSYPPADLTRTQHWVWNYTPISFAPTISAPSSVTATPDATGNWYFSYVVTAVTNSPPNESLPSAVANCMGAQLNSNTGEANTVSWSAITGATLYRVYKANPTIHEAIPAGAMYGYIGTATGTSFVDIEIGPDFTQSPPMGTNPFNAGPIVACNVLKGGTGIDPNATLTVSDVAGTGAVLTPTIVGGVITNVSVTNGGQNYEAPIVSVANAGTGAAGHINVSAFGQLGCGVTATITNGGQDYFGKVTVAPAAGLGCKFTPTISNGVITKITVTGAGTGYVDGAALVFTQLGGLGATFDVSVGAGGEYPGCATYFQQRKVFAGSVAGPQTFWMTKPADFKNMDVSNPSQASDAITATIAATQVNAIKWMVPMNNLVLLTSSGSWLLIGGAMVSSPVAVTPSNTVVVPQNYVGCADLPPIVVNYDILYVQAKGSVVRDLAYNFWANVYTGEDKCVLAQHLFFGHNMERWAYAEQPFYQVWCVRDDGVLLSFTYLKEQDVYAWAHHDSPGNSGVDVFESVASIPEQQIPGLNMDSVYVIVQRTIPGINGGNPVKYVERMDGRNFLTNGVSDVTKAWFMDCGLQYYNGGVQSQVITGIDHLNGATVSILADGNVQAQQVVVGGAITLQAPAARVTVGLPYVAQLQTLCMEPEGIAAQVQSFRKKISTVTLRVADTRGLMVGPSFDDLDEMKERAAAVYMGTSIPLFTGDERIVIDNRYVEEDDVCIQQSYPLPCTVLGVIPDVTIGDN